MVVARTFTLRRFFLADSIPFLIAAGTSLALPVPNPTIRAPGSPTTTRAEKLRFLPPLTTLVTRLMETTCSLRFSPPASMRFAAVVDIRDKSSRPRTEARLRELHRPRLSPGRDRDTRRGRTPRI